jgi:hypothetical protein
VGYKVIIIKQWNFNLLLSWPIICRKGVPQTCIKMRSKSKIIVEQKQYFLNKTTFLPNFHFWHSWSMHVCAVSFGIIIGQPNIISSLCYLNAVQTKNNYLIVVWTVDVLLDRPDDVGLVNKTVELKLCYFIEFVDYKMTRLLPIIVLYFLNAAKRKIHYLIVVRGVEVLVEVWTVDVELVPVEETLELKLCSFIKFLDSKLGFFMNLILKDDRKCLKNLI